MAMAHRSPIAQIPGGAKLVASVDDRLDSRQWVEAAGLHTASSNSLTVALEHLPTVIEALQQALRREAA
jgi:hypothetical protein